MRLRWPITARRTTESTQTEVLWHDGLWHGLLACAAVSRITKKQRIAELAAERGWHRITAAEWEQIISAIPGATAAHIEDAGLIVEQPWRGVRQHTFDELAESLLELAAVYPSNPRLARAQVITAKDRAKWAARSPRVDPAKKVVKAEMAEWMLVWLDDPAMFRAWVARRRAVLNPEST
jgi:hypothetical protein